MLAQALLLLFAAFLAVDGAVLGRGHALRDATSSTTCGCTTTVTRFVAQGLLPRQDCPATSTITVYQAPPTVWVVSGDPSSIASSFSYASQIDSMVHHQSSEDRPTGEPPETTPIAYTATAYGPAIVGTDYPYDESILYHNIGTTTAPVSTTVFIFPAETTPAQRGNIIETVTTTTYLSTTTVLTSESTTSSSNSSITGPAVQKRQVCSMIFAEINGEWVHWCNEWDGSTTVKHSHYDSTKLILSPPGADPVPSSAYTSLLTSEATETLQTNPPEESASATTASPSATASTPQMISSSNTGGVTSAIPATATITITYPIATVISTSTSISSSSTVDVPGASPSCGQVGEFLITFDDLPPFSTDKPDNETTAPPIFDPYDHFKWSAGFGYGPPPNEPFAPHDGLLLAEYNPAYAPSTLPPHAQGRDLPGSFGAGPRSSNNIYWFNAQSVYIGCNSTGPEAPCIVVATGYRWIASTVPNATISDGYEQLAFVKDFQVPGPCPDKSCPLTQISFDVDTFIGLSTLNMVASSRDGENVGFYLDSFQGLWTNNTCEAGLERSMSRR